MRNSRLARRSLKQSKKQLYGSLIAIVVIVFIALNFGPSLIGSVGTVIDALIGKSSESSTVLSDAGLQPPLLDRIPEATSSDSVNITGTSYYQEGEIELFLNGVRYKAIDLLGQDFEFKNVRLSEGENLIKTRYVTRSKKSDFSSEEKIIYIKGSPKLELTSPSDHVTFTKADQEITVRGTTDSENTVRVNDFIAVVDSGGNFSHLLKLSEGDNKITVSAANPAGNTTTKEVTVFYSP